MSLLSSASWARSSNLSRLPARPWTWDAVPPLNPVGLDFTPTYIEKYCASGHQGVVGAAQALPFPSSHFQTVWSIGLLHHLSDEVAKQAVEEMSRVCRSDGWVVILDAVMPSPPWGRPIAYVLRRLDRGSFVRQEAGLDAILRDVAGSGAIHSRRNAPTGLPTNHVRHSR